jgi:hypothetical protein
VFDGIYDTHILVSTTQRTVVYANVKSYSLSWLGSSYIPNQCPNCLQQNTCAEANNGTASRKGPRFVYNLKCHLHVNKVLPLDGILCQLNRIATLTQRFLVMQLNIIIEPTPGSHKQLHFSAASSVILRTFLIFVVYRLVPFIFPSFCYCHEI